MEPEPTAVPGELPPDALAAIQREQRAFRRKLIISIVVAAVSALASVAAIGGQLINYRQMRALERIADTCGK